MLLLIFFGINLLNSFNVTKIVDIVVRTCAIKTGLSILDFSYTNIQVIEYFILSLDKSRDRCTKYPVHFQNLLKMYQSGLLDIIELVQGWLWAVICQCCQIIIYAEIVWGSRCSGVMQSAAQLTELCLIIQSSIYQCPNTTTATPGTCGYNTWTSYNSDEIFCLLCHQTICSHAGHLHGLW